MNKTEFEGRMNYVMSEDEKRRVDVIIREDGALLVNFDPHGLDVRNARRGIKNIISLNGDAFTMVVIHGYNRGTAIKDMIRKEDISNRIIHKYCMADNPGRTVINISARCA